MGQHDPLDGLVTCAQLRATAASLGSSGEGPDLAQELAGFAAMLRPAEWETADPLGLGGLLIDACRVAQLPDAGPFRPDDLVQALLTAALPGLRAYERHGELEEPAARRLAFRELGLAIGLHAVALIGSRSEERHGGSGPLPALVAALRRHVPLGKRSRSSGWSPRTRRERSGPPTGTSTRSCSPPASFRRAASSWFIPSR